MDQAKKNGLFRKFFSCISNPKAFEYLLVGSPPLCSQICSPLAMKCARYITSLGG